jgi:hypothetical protein
MVISEKQMHHKTKSKRVAHQMIKCLFHDNKMDATRGLGQNKDQVAQIVQTMDPKMQPSTTWKHN